MGMDGVFEVVVSKYIILKMIYIKLEVYNGVLSEKLGFEMRDEIMFQQLGDEFLGSIDEMLVQFLYFIGYVNIEWDDMVGFIGLELNGYGVFIFGYDRFFMGGYMMNN